MKLYTASLVATLHRQAGILLLLSVPLAVQAQFNCTTNNGTITITGFTGSGGVVSIPSAINGLPVTSIGDWAFYSASLTNLTIPGSVTNVGDGAFFDCHSLTNVSFGDGVTAIGDWAFAFCSNLTSVSFRGNAPTLMGVDVFYNDTAATVYHLAGTSGWGSTFGGRPAVLWSPPTLPVQTDRTIAQYTALIVSNTAIGTNIASLGLTYNLVGAPSGATVDTSGIITWTPGAGQGHTTNVITTVVAATILPSSATNRFAVVVDEINVAPVLPVQTNRLLLGRRTLVVTNTATAPDIPNTNVYSYPFCLTNGGAIPPNSSPGTASGTLILTQPDILTLDMTYSGLSSDMTQVNGSFYVGNGFGVNVGFYAGDLPPSGHWIDTRHFPIGSVLQSIAAGHANLQLGTLNYPMGGFGEIGGYVNPVQSPEPLSYQLTGPAGAVIDTNGVITWTPTATQVPSHRFRMSF